MYGYDALYRLTSAVTTGSTGYPRWGLSETYDRYGNRTAQSVTAGSGPSNSVTVSATTNRITTAGYAYDANGNMTNDGANTLVFDGENNNVTASNGGASGNSSSSCIQQQSQQLQNTSVDTHVDVINGVFTTQNGNQLATEVRRMTTTSTVDANGNLTDMVVTTSIVFSRDPGREQQVLASTQTTTVHNFSEFKETSTTKNVSYQAASSIIGQKGIQNGLNAASPSRMGYAARSTLRSRDTYFRLGDAAVLGIERGPLGAAWAGLRAAYDIYKSIQDYREGRLQ